MSKDDKTDILSDKGLVDLIDGINLEGMELRDGIYRAEASLKSGNNTMDRHYGMPFVSDYAEFLCDSYSNNFFDYPFSSLFKNQTVVDLGAGPNIYGYRFTQVTGASAYVGVELYFANALKTNLMIGNPEPLKEAKSIPVAVVSEDMLTFLKRVPEKSVSILFSGIDEFILSNDYFDETYKEISRVLHPEGTFMKRSMYKKNPPNLRCHKILFNVIKGVRNQD